MTTTARWSASASEAAHGQRTIELRGHVIDTGQLGQTLDNILESGGDYVVERFVLSKTKADDSYARIQVQAPTSKRCGSSWRASRRLGVTAVDPKDANVEPAPSDGVFPEGFTPARTWRRTCVWLATGCAWPTLRWTAHW